MQQIVEFVTNNALLSAGFMAVLAVLLWTELRQRTQGYKILSPAEAVLFMNHQGASVLDVSAQADFAKGHIADAVQMPLSRLGESDKQVAALLSKPVLVVCKAGQAAGAAASALMKAGATDVAVLKGGMAAWASEHYPVTKGK